MVEHINKSKVKSPRRHRWLRIIGMLLMVLIVCFIGLKLYLSPTRIQGLLESTLSDSFGRPVKTKSTSVGLDGHIIIKGLVVENPTGFSPSHFLTADELTLTIDYLPILQKRIYISSLNLVNPLITLEQNSAGHWNFELPGPVLVKDYRVDSLVVQNADILYPVYPSASLDSIQIKIQNFAKDKPMDLNLSARIASQPDSMINLSGTINVFKAVPTGKVTLLTRHIDPLQLAGITTGRFPLDSQWILDSPGQKTATLEGSVILPQYSFRKDLPTLQGETIQFVVAYDQTADRVDLVSLKTGKSGIAKINLTGNIESAMGESTAHLTLSDSFINLTPFLPLVESYQPGWKGEGVLNIPRLSYVGYLSQGKHQVEGILNLSKISASNPKMKVKVQSADTQIQFKGVYPSPEFLNVKVTGAASGKFDTYSWQLQQLHASAAMDSSFHLTRITASSPRTLIQREPLSWDVAASGSHLKSAIRFASLDPTSFMKDCPIQGKLTGNISLSGPVNFNGNYQYNGTWTGNNIRYQDKTFSSAKGTFSGEANTQSRKLVVRNITLDSPGLVSLSGSVTVSDWSNGKADGTLLLHSLNLSSIMPMVTSDKSVTLQGDISGKLEFNYFLKNKQANTSLELTGTHIAGQDTTLSFSVHTISITGTANYTDRKTIQYNLSSRIQQGRVTIPNQLEALTNLTLSGTGQYSPKEQLVSGIFKVENGHFTDTVYGVTGDSLRAELAAQYAKGRGVIADIHNISIDTVQVREVTADSLRLHARLTRDDLNILSFTGNVLGGNWKSHGLVLFSGATLFQGGIEVSGISTRSAIEVASNYTELPYLSKSGLLSAKAEGYFSSMSSFGGFGEISIHRVNLVKEDVTLIRRFDGLIPISFNQDSVNIQPFTLYVENRLQPRLEAHLANPWSGFSTMSGTVSAVQSPESLNTLQDVLFEFLPSMIQDATLSGEAGVRTTISLDSGKFNTAGTLTITSTTLVTPDVSVYNLQASIPLDNRYVDEEGYYPIRFTRDNYSIWNKLLQDDYKTGPVSFSADSVIYGIIHLDDIRAIVGASSQGIQIPVLTGKLFGGSVWLRSLLDSEGKANAGLLLEDISLKQVCDAQESTRGMISGRISGMILLADMGSSLSGIRGNIHLWAIPSNKEKRAFSREFLKKAAGRDLPPVYVHRSYDDARLRVTISDGFLTFDELLMEGKLFGKPMTSIGINPSGNKVSLNNMLDWISGLSESDSGIRTEIK